MIIQKADLFKELSTEFLNAFDEIKAEEFHGQGAYVFKEGDPADCFFLLGEGRVRLSIGEKGHIIYTINNPGEVFGWSSLVEHDVYTASAECTLPSKLVKVEKARMNKLLEKHQADGLIFFRRLAGIIGQRLMSNYNMQLSSMQERESLPSYG